MERSHWKGHISFGLVSIPILLYPSVNKAADISFHQIDKRNNARIKYRRFNESTGKEVKWENIIKGYEYDKDTIIPVPEKAFADIAGDNSRTVAIETFINKKDLDLITIDKSYYVVPEKNGIKGYVILRDALISTGKVGIAKVIISTREYLAALMPYENKALVLYLLKYDKEMRKLADLDIPTKSLATYKIKKMKLMSQRN